MTAPSFPLADVSRLCASPALLGPAQGRSVYDPTTVVALFERFRGAGRIAGTVKVITTPAPARIVRLRDRASGVLARQTLSDASGNYSFANLFKGRKYDVTAYDQDGGFNAAIADNVEPA